MYLDYEFELRYGFGLETFWTAIIRYFIGAGLENTWATNLDYNYYILLDLEFKKLGLWIWISPVIYLTRLGLENNWKYEFGLQLVNFTWFGLGNTWTVI